MSALDSNAGVDLYCPTCEGTFGSGERCPTDNTRLVRIARREDRLIGRELDGRYTIVEAIGQGAMGTVYRGTQHSVGREVAIKVVNATLVNESQSIRRFLREAKLASRLVHPNAVAVLEFGQTDDGMFYLVMELVTGRTLDKLLAAERALTPPRLVRIGAQICDALEGAHALEIVHRDLKPANIMIMATGRDLVKVLDFGLAKSLASDASTATMTNAGALIGTPAYMPPELVTGEPVDARADLYSLGCILYEAAAGRPPFTAVTVHELIAMHASEPPPPLARMPRRLAQVIERLLAKSPNDRYQTAAQAREALEASLATDTGPVAAVPETIDPTIVSGPQTILGWSGLTKTGDAKRASSPIPQLVPASASGPIAQRPRVATPAAGVLRPLVEMPALRASTPAAGVRPLTPAAGLRPLTPPAGVPQIPLATPTPLAQAAPQPMRPAQPHAQATPQPMPTVQVPPHAHATPQPMPTVQVPPLADATPQPMPLPPPVASPTARIALPSRTKSLLVAGALVVLGLAALAAYWIVGRTQRAATTGASESTHTSPGAASVGGSSRGTASSGAASSPSAASPSGGSSRGTVSSDTASATGTAPGAAPTASPGAASSPAAASPSAAGSSRGTARQSATQRTPRTLPPAQQHDNPDQPVLANPGPGM